ncbi:hypothetical protein AMJ49_05570 [Parcubacteria bacterium DG_74_2]|nr:MAG: hypothetical protein AMJ49_05570 [Parcubacteria bacterium DG_74_2]
MNFNETDEFSKDFKRLSKKYRSLSDDLLEFKKVVSEIPLGAGKHFAMLTATETVKIIKARLFCRYLKGSSLRIIYAYCEAKKMIEFIEVYPKSEKEREDRQRINNYLSDFE